jgi:hypothetical protein
VKIRFQENQDKVGGQSMLITITISNTLWEYVVVLCYLISQIEANSYPLLCRLLSVKYLTKGS